MIRRALSSGLLPRRSLLWSSSRAGTGGAKKRKAKVEAAYSYRDPWVPSKKTVSQWTSQMAERGQSECPLVEDWDTAIQEMYAVVQTNAMIRGYVEEMLMHNFNEDTTIDSVEEWCATMNCIIKSAPEFATEGDLIGVPMGALLTTMSPTYAGFALFRSEKFNNAMRDVLLKWQTFLDSSASQYVLNEGDSGWLSPAAQEACKLDDYEKVLADKPYYPSWNSFFSRNLLPGKRDVDLDPAAIASSNDGHVFRWREQVQLYDQFYLKSMEYSLMDMLGSFQAQYGRKFENGTVFQSFLNPTDFHRWWSPVDGTVRLVHTEPGCYYSKLESQGADLDGGSTASCPYLTHVNARGIVIIETANMGLVCCMPIGMCEVSTIKYSINEGQKITKGDELGCFLFGGSSFATIFQDQTQFGQKLVFEESIPSDPEMPSVDGSTGVAIRVGQRIAHLE